MKQALRLLLKVILFPLRLLNHLMGVICSPLIKRVDASAFLSNWINQISSSMATQRGILLMIGTGMLILSLITHALVLSLLVASKNYDRTLYWLCIPFSLMHVGVLLGFTGTMLATPLGQGYKDNK